ncbi:MAG TPA: SsrA-binding protein SmpB [Candidatus Binatia bacterium]|jgi:SsrA-binding protein|nr:SsrA-binding protein SmpB [Candidatus Binatia bacterium]
MAKKRNEGIEIVARNRRASHDYHLLENFEAGLALTGTEIKSVRAHKVSLQRAYVTPRGDELWLVEANISPYEHGNRENHDAVRPRKLLLHRREINNILEALQTKGMTMVPTKMYLKDGWAKVTVALAKGKKLYDKRADIARRDSERQVERALREKYRY